MTAKSSPPEDLPEAGSESGVNLRDRAFARLTGLQAPADFTRGALYCVYPRAFSEEGFGSFPSTPSAGEEERGDSALRMR
jgi:hypothetical protein